MSISEVMSDAKIIEDLEKGNYRNSNNVEEVKTKIEEFSHWFNSTARLTLLRCLPEDNEVFIYLLLNLEKKLQFAISELNRSVHHHCFSCNKCSEEIEVKTDNFWESLQEHEHFEESLTETSEMIEELIETPEESSTSSVKETTEEMTNMTIVPPVLNDFRFNFVVEYDQRIEEALYPEAIVNAAYRRDFCEDYTVQRIGARRGYCLLCPCNLISRGRTNKVNAFTAKNHAGGQKHIRAAQLGSHIFALKKYHEFWRSQEPNYQSHQVHFIPVVGNNVLKCNLCNDFIYFDKIIEHLKNNNHRDKIIKVYNSPEGKLNEFYLIEMQVAIYESGMKMETVVVKQEVPKETKNGPLVNNGVAVKPRAECVIEKVILTPNSINLPPRYKEHLDFFVKISDLVKCNLCKVDFNNISTDIKSHIFNGRHRQLSRVELIPFKYFCEICDVRFNNEWEWEDHFKKGPNRHDSMTETRKLKLSEYECNTCLLVIFGDELSLNRHRAKRQGSSRKAKEVRLPVTIRRLFASKAFIHEEAIRLQNEVIQMVKCRDKMEDCCKDLEQVLMPLYPNCKAYYFGSRVSGLGTDKSDLDVFMDTGDMYLGERHQDAQSQEEFVKRVSKALRSCKEIFSNVVPIASARTPIVKVRHNYTGLDCDVSFRHGLGVENTKFLRFCIDLQPITQPFILFLKKWSAYCKLKEHITNYALALMAIFFLQTREYLVSAQVVRNHNSSPALRIDGWETLNCTSSIEEMRQLVKVYPADVRQLLRDFFQYFSKYDYANQVVCPLLGRTVPKLSFNENPQLKLPIEMKSYVERIQNENGEQFRGLSPFCIQDPFDLSHNLTKACQNGTIIKLKELCRLTYELLDTLA